MTRLETWSHELLVLALLGCLVALVPLAHASPPDPTWIGGLYDDADYDDVVMAVTGAAAIVAAEPVTVDRTLWIVVDLALVPLDLLSPRHAASPRSIRAPPIA